MKYKKKYAVIRHLVDCEEDWGVTPLCGEQDNEPLSFDTPSAARKAMKEEYEEFNVTCDAVYSGDGKDHCKRNVGKDEISIDVPMYDAENDRDSWIRVRWKVVGL